MRKLFGKMVLFVVLVSGLTILPGAAEACFDCYCNGDYVGCVTTINYCWNACQPQDTKSSVQALDPRNSCTQETQNNQPVFFCSSEPASK